MRLDDSIEMLDLCMTSFFSNDLMRANRIVDSVYKCDDTFQKIQNEILSIPTETAIVLHTISDSIHRIGEYSADIAEEIINFCLKKRSIFP
ncbi:PhoU domain-containing protein [uncultured Methanospirillum sp.]|uniref:PhoU domain-containing protein n=1 Tax=uncultured Methanospirillum sp. TaxID=262503 RepID=UPI0029C7F0C9|nr:PhoU domain-containing protein [uncultured Methanospirillum sp.]